MKARADVTTLTAALAYAARGWPVFPCRSGTKRPATAHGLHDATTDPERIRAWWSDNSRANVGIVTGPASGLLVLDIDGDPHALLEGRAIPPSPTQRTGGGGWQVFFEWGAALDGAATTRAGLLSGVDTRGGGGYVVAPPSVHPSGTRYRWCRSARPEDLLLAAPPMWLLTLSAPRQGSRLAAPVRRDTRHADSYVLRAIERECAMLAGTPQGTRNATLNRSAFALLRFVVAGQAAAEPVVRALAYAAAHAGLPEREITRTLKSALGARGVAL